MRLRRANDLRSEAGLLERASNWAMHSSLESLTATSLRELSACEGVDFATAVLFDRLCKSPRHGDFIRRIDGLRKAPLPRKLPDTKVVIVPGALYIERPELGGDGRSVRGVAERFGYETDLIPLASFGAVTTNARLICDWLHKYGHQRMILVSLSKGSADLKLALESLEAGTLFRNAVAWVNVCGPLNGTRMANWIFDSRLRSWCFRAKCLLQRRDFGLITDLRCASDAPLAKAVQLPPAMQMLSLVGFPLRQDMTTQHSRFCHRTLAAWGPNDGTTSLADLVTWPGNIYPVWGADHYFKPETLASELIAALLHYIAETPWAI